MVILTAQPTQSLSVCPSLNANQLRETEKTVAAQIYILKGNDSEDWHSASAETRRDLMICIAA